MRVCCSHEPDGDYATEDGRGGKSAEPGLSAQGRARRASEAKESDAADDYVWLAG